MYLEEAWKIKTDTAARLAAVTITCGILGGRSIERSSADIWIEWMDELGVEYHDFGHGLMIAHSQGKWLTFEVK